jgi:hypothetical protein
MSSLSVVRRQSIDLNGESLNNLSQDVISTVHLKQSHAKAGRSILIPNHEDCTFIILGRPGQGKSTISNKLGGYDIDDGPFTVSPFMSSCTKNVEKLGNIIDTPGMPDTDDSSVMSLVYADALLKVCNKAGVKNINIYVIRPERITQSSGTPSTFGIEFDLELINFMSQPSNYYYDKTGSPFDQMIVVFNYPRPVSDHEFHERVGSIIDYCEKYRKDLLESVRILYAEGWIMHTSLLEENEVFLSKIEETVNLSLLEVESKGFAGTFSAKAMSNNGQIRSILKKYPVMSKSIGVHHLV